jgi:cobalamin biosynthesis Mg chelatase CobN
VSVLVLLALACFPVLAQADSSGAQYEEALPNPTGGHGSTGHGSTHHNSEPPAKSSSVPNGGASAPSSPNPSGSGSVASESNPVEGSSSNTGGVTNASHGDGKGQSSPDKASTGAAPKSAQPTVQTGGSTSSGGGGSSPLVPILVAIAVLAAISIGAVMIRQRRQRSGGRGSVSPKAS